MTPTSLDLAAAAEIVASHQPFDARPPDQRAAGGCSASLQMWPLSAFLAKVVTW